MNVVVMVLGAGRHFPLAGPARGKAIKDVQAPQVERLEE